MALLFLAIPTVSLGSLCFFLFQHNLHLSEKNNELKEIATEVTSEVDTLGQEIDSLRARAGIQDSASQSDRLIRSTRSALLGSPEDDTTKTFPPRGGPANAIEALSLLKDAKRQVPRLNRDLDSAIKPALEETLAEEAAYPDGQPMVGTLEVSSEFGIRSNPFSGGGYEVHEGIDFVGAQGDIIAATGDGVVTKAGPNGGYGNSVTIDHSYGYETLYAHMSEVRVKVGDRVKRGQIIGHVGSTGRSSGPHLHYSLYKEGKAINPRSLLKLPAKASQARAERPVE
jgi:murein DD-endopeptidase MepM/ murein hydrolase activator NlpD